MADERPKRRPAGRRRLDSGSAYRAVEDSGGLLSREALTHTEEVPLPVEPLPEAEPTTDKEDRLVRVLVGLAAAILIWTSVYLYSQPSAPPPQPPRAAPAQVVAPQPAVAPTSAPPQQPMNEIDGVRVKASISSGVYEDGQAPPTGPAPAMDTPPNM